MKKLGIYSTIAVFGLIIVTFLLLGIFSPDRELSTWERRKLASFPEFTVETVFDGSFFKGLEKYSTDQFPGRDGFRTISALTRTDLFLQKDNNGLYVENDRVFKSDYPISTKHIDNFIDKTNEIYNKYIDGVAANYFVSAIPSKEFFDTSDHLRADASEIAEYFKNGIKDSKYIDIFGALTIDSYYRTDTHWSQDKLLPVMEIFAEQMNFQSSIPQYEEKVLEPFYGVYYGQSALRPTPDSLLYLTNSTIDSAQVKNVQKPNFSDVYDLDAFEGTDGYDLFLSGGTPLTVITSPESETEKELVIFRDSFGSSIAPLFLNEYRKVTLVDLRYFSADLLPEYVNFEDSDVLVLYSTLMLNSEIILK